MLQKDEFLSGEGNAWYGRVLKKRGYPDHDPVTDMLARLGRKPGRILEIGSSDGWRLNFLQTRFGAECHGIDPSSDAVEQSARLFPRLSIRQGTADALPYDNGMFDVVIFGWCLPHTDVTDHFRIAAEADRVLASPGMLAIDDFLPPTPCTNPYHHKPELVYRKMQWSGMFTWHPAYTLLERALVLAPDTDNLHPDNRLAVDILAKDIRLAFPLNPFPRFQPLDSDSPVAG